jgi:hypothetical protein
MNWKGCHGVIRGTGPSCPRGIEENYENRPNQDGRCPGRVGTGHLRNTSQERHHLSHLAWFKILSRNDNCALCSIQIVSALNRFIER